MTPTEAAPIYRLHRENERELIEAHVKRRLTELMGDSEALAHTIDFVFAEVRRGEHAPKEGDA